MTSAKMAPSVEQAAANNAFWCDAVCRAHGLPGEVHDGLWLNRHRVPRFYPNAVTLSESQETATQLWLIQDLLAAELPGDTTVKDSFCTLDLAPLGFDVLFEATWLWRSPSDPRPAGALDEISWAVVRDEGELAKWERAWNGISTAGRFVLPPRIFLPSLLADRDVVFVAAHQGAQIVAGAIANRTGDIVGMSNVFAPDDQATLFWAGCLSQVLDIFPGLPLVDYESGRDLDIALSLGFEALAPLRVWSHSRRPG